MLVKSEIYNFLSNFRPNNILNIIEDIKLINDGYKIYYIVDTYDIVNYALPFIDESKIDINDKSQLSHKAIAYDCIFNNNEDKNLLILDEYKLELLSIKNNIFERLKGFSKVKKQLYRLFQQDKIRNESNVDNIVKLIKDNFEIIIAIQIFSEYGDNIYQRFFKLLNENIYIFDFESTNTVLEEIIVNVFDENRPSKITNDLFDLFVKDIQFKLLSMDTDMERYLYLENAYRDIAVIERILKVNETFKVRFPSKKVIFQYLSSTPFKTDKLFDLLKKMTPKYGLEINRNIFQCYLLKILKSLSINKYSVESIMELLHKVMLQKAFAEESIKRDWDKNETNNIVQNKLDPLEKLAIIDTINKLLNDSVNDIKNTFLYKTYEEHKNKLNISLNNIKEEKHREELLDFFKKTDSYLNKNSSLIQNFASNTISIQKYRKTYILANRFYDKKAFYHEIKIPYGKDIIRNNFQHLPVLLFITEKENEYKDLMYQIFDLILAPKKLSNDESNSFNLFIINIINRLTKLSAKNLKDITFEFLILSYLNIITKSSPAYEEVNSKNIEENETEILSELETQKELLKDSIITSVVNIDKKKIEIQSREISYLREIDYLILWLKRRNFNCINEGNEQINCNECDICNYDRVIKFGIECTENYPDDGRFYHGLALAYHSQAYGFLLSCKKPSNKDTKVIEHLGLSRYYLKLANRKYKSLERIIKESLPLSLLRKNIIAVHNTLIDGMLREFEMSDHKNNKLLLNASTEFKQIRNYFNLVDDNLYNYPTISHTEAELNYYEANKFFEDKKYPDALEKILSATSLIKYFVDNKLEIRGNFMSIISKISILRFKIFSQLGYLK